MSEKLKFYKGLEENLVNIIIELGAIYHCTDTGNTYIGVIDLEGEVLEDGTYPLKLDLYSTVSDIYISDDEIEGGFEFVNADTLGGFPADEYALKSHVYEKIDEININNYATKEEVNALTYENVGAAPAGDYAIKDDLNAIDFPVDSVNGKTGVVALVAEDVGAPTIEYAKKVGAPHNLLVNSNFRNPINSSGESEGTYDAWGACLLDHWYAYSNGATMSLASDGLHLVGGIHALQYDMHASKWDGRKLTFAVKANGQVVCCSCTVVYTGSTKYIASIANDTVELSIHEQKNDYLYFVISATEETIIEWAAIYEGEYTADNLTEYQPKDYAVEALACAAPINHKLVIDNGNNWEHIDMIDVADNVYRIRCGSFGNYVTMDLTASEDNTDNNRIVLTLRRNISEGKPFGHDALMLRNAVDGVTTSTVMFGGHNKPYGSYTGNGSATSRTVNVGTSISNLLLIETAGSRFTIVGSRGAVALGATLKSVQYLAESEINYNNTTGILTIASGNDVVNCNGWGYQYRVL